MGPLVPQVTASPSKSDMFAVMAVGEDFTKTRLWKEIYIRDVWSVWGGVVEDSPVTLLWEVLLWFSACPNKIHPPQTSSIFICHTLVNIRSYEGVCAQRTQFFFYCLSLCWIECISPLSPWFFFFFFCLIKPCKFQTLVSNCATAWAIRGTFTRRWFVGNLTYTGVFLFFHSLYDHTWPLVWNDESVTVCSGIKLSW